MKKKNKLWTIIGVSALVVVLLAAGLIGHFAPAADPHAGHNHGDEGQTQATDEHGHAVGEHDNENKTEAQENTPAKIVYAVQQNEDGTYSFVLKDRAGKVLFTQNGLDRAPLAESVSKDVFTLGWPTGQGPNDFKQIYCNTKTGKYSPVFDGPVASDGVRVLLPKGVVDGEYLVEVRDLFNEKGYSKTHVLKSAYTEGSYAVMGGKLAANKRQVHVTYCVDKDGAHTIAMIDLYAE